MHSMAQMFTQGYHFGAPSQEAEDIDSQVAARMECRKCGSSMHYEGYHKTGRGYSEYVAVAVCDRCGYEVAF